MIFGERTKGIPPVLETLRDRWFTPEFALRSPEVIERRMRQIIETDKEVFLGVFDISQSVAAPVLDFLRRQADV
jgi:hypothetical protein